MGRKWRSIGAEGELVGGAAEVDDKGSNVLCRCTEMFGANGDTHFF
jgi:hypothetical protein